MMHAYWLVSIDPVSKAWVAGYHFMFPHLMFLHLMRSPLDAFPFLLSAETWTRKMPESSATRRFTPS